MASEHIHGGDAILYLNQRIHKEKLVVSFAQSIKLLGETYCFKYQFHRLS